MIISGIFARKEGSYSYTNVCLSVYVYKEGGWVYGIYVLADAESNYNDTDIITEVSQCSASATNAFSGVCVARRG